jgi:hypothetical protein
MSPARLLRRLRRRFDIRLAQGEPFTMPYPAKRLLEKRESASAFDRNLMRSSEEILPDPSSAESPPR